MSCGRLLCWEPTDFDMDFDTELDISAEVD